MKRSSILAAVALLTVLAATPAQAGWRIDRALAVANAVWHQPCNGQATVRWEWPENAGTDLQGVRAVTVDGQCTIYLAPDLHEPWPVFCTIVLHEMGHVAGYQDPTNTADPWHSSNPRSIMYAELTPDVGRSMWKAGTARFSFPGADRRCDARGRPFLARQT